MSISGNLPVGQVTRSMYLTLQLYAVVKSEGTHLTELPAMGTVVKATSSGRMRRSAAAMAPWFLSSALASSSARRCRSCLALQKCCRQRATGGFAQHERADACSASPLCHETPAFCGWDGIRT